MNDEFVTEAFKNDRYLKATRLIDRFEEEIIRELENAHKRLMEEKPGLFKENTSLSDRVNKVRSSPLSNIRVDSNLRNVE